MPNYFKDKGFIQSIIPAMQEGLNNYNTVRAAGEAVQDIYHGISNIRAGNASRALGDYMSNPESSVSLEDARRSLNIYKDWHDPKNESHTRFLNTAREALTDEAVQSRDESLAEHREAQKAQTLERQLTGVSQAPMSLDDQIQSINEGLFLSVGSPSQMTESQRRPLLEDFGGEEGLNRFESKYNDLMASRELERLDTLIGSKKTLENTKEIASIIRSLLVKRKEMKVPPATAVKIDDAIYAYKVEHGGKRK